MAALETASPLPTLPRSRQRTACNQNKLPQSSIKLMRSLAGPRLICSGTLNSFAGLLMCLIRLNPHTEYCSCRYLFSPACSIESRSQSLRSVERVSVRPYGFVPNQQAATIGCNNGCNGVMPNPWQVKNGRIKLHKFRGTGIRDVIKS